MQAHPNGVKLVSGVTMVAADPADHAEFLSAFTNIRAFSASSAGLRFEPLPGALECLSEEAFAFEFGFRCPGEGARLAAFTVVLDNLAALEERFTSAAIPFSRHRDQLVISPDHAFGVAIRFIAA